LKEFKFRDERRWRDWRACCTLVRVSLLHMERLRSVSWGQSAISSITPASLIICKKRKKMKRREVEINGNRESGRRWESQGEREN
jgi:hypothetical protein